MRTASFFRCPWHLIGSGAAARFDQDIRQQQARDDLHRRDVRHVDRLFLASNPLRRVLHDARGCDEHLRREESVAAAQPARAKDVARRKWPAFAPHHQEPEDQEKSEDPEGPPCPTWQRVDAYVHAVMLSYFLRKEIALFAASRPRLAREVPQVVSFWETHSLLPAKRQTYVSTKHLKWELCRLNSRRTHSD